MQPPRRRVQVVKGLAAMGARIDGHDTERPRMTDAAAARDLLQRHDALLEMLRVKTEEMQKHLALGAELQTTFPDDAPAIGDVITAIRSNMTSTSERGTVVRRQCSEWCAGVTLRVVLSTCLYGAGGYSLRLVLWVRGFACMKIRDSIRYAKSLTLVSSGRFAVVLSRLRCVCLTTMCLIIPPYCVPPCTTTRCQHLSFKADVGAVEKWIETQMQLLAKTPCGESIAETSRLQTAHESFEKGVEARQAMLRQLESTLVRDLLCYAML